MQCSYISIVYTTIDRLNKPSAICLLVQIQVQETMIESAIDDARKDRCYIDLCVSCIPYRGIVYGDIQTMITLNHSVPLLDS